MQEPEWINISTQQPQEGQQCWTYFHFSGVEVATYYDLSTKNENNCHDRDLFTYDNGFLTDDVQWWMPYEAGQETPLPPFNFDTVTDMSRNDLMQNELSGDHERNHSNQTTVRISGNASRES